MCKRSAPPCAPPLSVSTSIEVKQLMTSSGKPNRYEKASRRHLNKLTGEIIEKQIGFDAALEIDYIYTPIVKFQEYPSKQYILPNIVKIKNMHTQCTS